MNTQAIKNAVAESAAVCGVSGYEISISTAISAAAEALKQEISSVTYSNESSLTVRCVKDGKSGYAASGLVTPEEAAALVERACANAQVVDDEDEVPLFEGSAHYEEVEQGSAELPSADEMKAHTMELQAKLYAASDKVVDGSQAFTQGQAGETVFINSAGVDLSYAYSAVLHGVVAAVKDGDEAEENYEMAQVDKETTDETVNRAVSVALGKLGAETVDSGKYNIIIDSDTMRSLLGVYSAVFSARRAYLKTTLLAGKEGEVVASPLVNIIDDPFHPKKFGHCPFDAEGVAVYKKHVIENGVLKTLLYNRMYAKKFGCETTGNAASATNIEPKGLYLEAGELSKDELLTKLGHGIYITSFAGLHAGADVNSGDFSLQATGFLVEDGKKTKPVKNFTVADNFFDLLKRVVALSNEVDFGAAGRIGAPQVMISDVSISGK